MNTFTRRARAGALYLDNVRPGWAERVNVDTLDMDDPRYCVLGEVFAYERPPDVKNVFLWAVDKLLLSDAEQDKYGFDAHITGIEDEYGLYVEDGDEQTEKGLPAPCTLLAAAWREEIAARREA